MPTINLKLTKAGIAQAKKEIKKYQKEVIKKCKVFARELAKAGIEVAEQNTDARMQVDLFSDEWSSLSGYITFTREVDPETYGATAIMTGVPKMIVARWILADGTAKEAEVNPLLMAEFGSGAKAISGDRFAGNPPVGRGTFPGQTHANNPDGWWWKGMDGEWHHSSGVKPHSPMWKAMVEMQKTYTDIAKRVFQ